MESFRIRIFPPPGLLDFDGPLGAAREGDALAGMESGQGRLAGESVQTMSPRSSESAEVFPPVVPKVLPLLAPLTLRLIRPGLRRTVEVLGRADAIIPRIGLGLRLGLRRHRPRWAGRALPSRGRCAPRWAAGEKNPKSVWGIRPPFSHCSTRADCRSGSERPKTEEVSHVFFRTEASFTSLVPVTAVRCVDGTPLQGWPAALGGGAAGVSVTLVHLHRHQYQTMRDDVIDMELRLGEPGSLRGKRGWTCPEYVNIGVGVGWVVTAFGLFAPSIARIPETNSRVRSINAQRERELPRSLPDRVII
jgi:hypothetical protein